MICTLQSIATNYINNYTLKLCKKTITIRNSNNFSQIQLIRISIDTMDKEYLTKVLVLNFPSYTMYIVLLIMLFKKSWWFLL